jgi:hypothetical protein
MNLTTHSLIYSSSQKMFSDVKSNSVTRAGRHVDHALVSIYLVHIIVPVDVEVHRIGMLRLLKDKSLIALLLSLHHRLQ